ncbi:tumor protein p53-inducible nuclear protein 2 isoform X1 [Ambystoma mexicanum]|uniref:tumor protein p53-inducible nuclear protein 2 isoform X1 n=1 Tax=Ambystoma mexicanum TaxID=8296 RepID=UPI0037E7D4A4
MFQAITSLFFSESSSDCPDEEPKAFVLEEEDDGWLIIDLPVSYASTLIEEQRLMGSGPECTSLPPQGSPQPTASLPHSPCDCGTRSMPSQHDPSSMDESWFVTPPPCFTAEGPGPVSVESSPLEDLLIEHPSMSVYVTSNSIVVESVSARESESLSSRSSERTPSRNRVERRANHHPTSIAAKAALLEKVGQVRRIQRAKERVERNKLSRKALQRQNLTREVHPRRAKHLSNFVCQPSQRISNY